MTRISRHVMFMKMAEVAALRSTCFRRAVGAVLVSDNNVLSIGYNGPPSGADHCTGKTCPQDGVCIRAVHAEINALNRSSDRGADVDLYVTESPCATCAFRIIQERVIRLFFMHPYRLTEGLDLLSKSLIKVYRMTPSGYIIDHRTGELL